MFKSDKLKKFQCQEFQYELVKDKAGGGWPQQSLSKLDEKKMLMIDFD